MQYLINTRKQKSKAHIWVSEDTYCTMYSTGGLKKEKYQVYDDAKMRPICTMCANVQRLTILSERVEPYG